VVQRDLFPDRIVLVTCTSAGRRNGTPQDPNHRNPDRENPVRIFKQLRFDTDLLRWAAFTFFPEA
jgi:hypothetical protein